MGSFKAILTFGFLMVLAVGCGGGEEAATTEAAPEPAEEMTMEYPTASATLAARAGGTETGSLTFTQTADGVTVWASIEGAPPGAHGLHIHDVGDCSADDFTSAGEKPLNRCELVQSVESGYFAPLESLDSFELHFLKNG